jgi:(p)ppGpp synthase/HD superfamily hydrolase
MFAALFHDVLEDISREHAEVIAHDFGEDVLNTVREVSENKDPNTSEERPWKERKEEYLQKLKEDSLAAVMLSCADKIHNLISLQTSYKKEGEKSLKPFNSSKQQRLWFYGQVVEIACDRLENPITERLKTEFEKTRDLLLL